MNFVSYSDELLRYRPRRTGGLIVVEQVDSTQTLGRRIVDEYAREGAAAPDTDILAWRQVAGRGRQGRTWSSPPGHGVYATLIRTRSGSDWLGSRGFLPLRVGVALCRTLNRFLGDRCRLKWPNDLVVGPHKLGGILIEVVTSGGESVEGSTAALGFGVNYSADLASFGEPRATSVCREIPRLSPFGGTPRSSPFGGTPRSSPSGGTPSGSEPSLAELALELIKALDTELERDVAGDEVVASYEALSAIRAGDALRCQIGEELLEGRFLGFDERGFLRLGIGDEERVITAGEVFARGAG